MKLAMMMCSNCGGKKLEKREGGAYCPYCGREFVAGYPDEQEALLEALGTIKQEALANAHRILHELEEFFENLENACTREDVLKRLIHHKDGLDKAIPAPEPVSEPVGSQPSAEELFDEAEKYYDAEDYDKAAEYYRKAAEQGYAKAQCNLGYCYYYGQGVPVSHEKAAEWYRKAAEQGYARGQNNLGYCYYYGQGVSLSHETAVEWYKKAADQGDEKAQCNLGYCYYYGQGVPRSHEKAVEWYKKAAANGSDGAKAALKNLGY